MDDKYIKDIYDNLGGESVFGKYDDYYSLITSDESYIKDIYDNLGGESVFGSYDDYYSLVKKKDELQSTSQKVATESITKEEEPTTLLESSGEGFDYESFINKSEGEAVSELQSKLTGKGYTVEETGIGNALLVTDNITGEKTEIDLKPIQLFKGDTDRNVEEINKVKSLIEKPVDDKRYLISQNKLDTYKNDRNAFIQSLTDKYPNFEIQYFTDPNSGGSLRISKDGNTQDFNISKGRFNDADQFASINKFIYDNLTDEEAKNISNQIKVDQLKKIEEDIKNIESDIDISMESAEADFFNENYFKGLFSALEKSGYQVPDEAKRELESGKVLTERFSPMQQSMVPTLVNMDATDIQNGIEKYFGDNDEILDKIDTYNKSGVIQKRLEKINRAKKLATEVYYENLPDREGVKEIVRQLNKDAKDEEVEILANIKLAESDFKKIVDSIKPKLQELSVKYPDVVFNYYTNDKGELKITSSEPVDEVKEIMDRVNGVAKTYTSLLEKSRYDLEKINAKRETTDEFLEAGNRNYNIIDTAYADFKNAVTQLVGGVGVITTLAEGAVEDITGVPVSFGTIQTGLSSDVKMKMIRDDMAESREKVEKFYKTKRTYDEAIAEGSKFEFGVRTFSEQAPNIMLAVGTSGAGNAIGLSDSAISTLVATQFGITSAGQKYDELTTRQEFGAIAEKALEDLKKLKGIIPDDEYFTQKYELERAIEDSKISSTEKTLAVIGTGLVEGIVTRYIGTVPNSIKVIKDLRGSANFMDDILRSNYSASKKALGEIGKRTGGEVIEETSIDLLTQINDYAFLGDQIDLSSLDDVAVTSIITSGGMNVPSTAYSSILTQVNVNRYRSKINAITNQINTLKGVLSDPDLTDIQRSYIHNTISNNIRGIAEQTTNMEADAMLLGAENIREMITMSGVRNSMMKKAGVENDDSYEIANAKIDNYLKTLDKAEANKFIENMNFIDDRRNEILNKINYEVAVEKVFGDKGEEIAKDLDPSLTPQQKYVEVYKQIRQEINDNAKKEYDAIQKQEAGDISDAKPAEGVQEVEEEVRVTPEQEAEVGYTAPETVEQRREENELLSAKEAEERGLEKVKGQRWVVVNKVTGKLVYAPVKSEAQAIIDNMDYDYGEGDMVSQQKLNEIRGVKPEQEAEVEIKTEPTIVEGAPDGTYLNVGMIEGKDGRELTEEEIESALPDGVEVLEKTRLEKGENVDEPTLSIKTSRSLTDAEMKAFRETTGQLAIPQIVDGVGTMFGTTDWGPFNAEFFVMPDKSKLSDIAKPTTEGVSKLRGAFGRKAAGAMRVNTLKQKLAIEQQAEEAKKAIAKRYPNMKIEVFYNEADYHRAIGEADQSKGTYFNNKVYINLTRATETTVAHEVFHGILSNEIKSNAQVQALMKRFVDSLSRSQDPALVTILAGEVAKIESYRDIQNEEIMAELFGTLAGEYKRLRPQTKSLIKRFMDKLAKLLGLKKFTDAEVIDVLNTLAGKVATGQEVTTDDVSIISSVDNGSMQENTYLETDGIVVQTPSKRSSLINSNIKNSDLLDTADLAGKPLEVVYYDNFTSMQYSLRNRISGSVLNRQGEGGPGYSYRKVIKDNKIIGAFTTVTKGLNLIQGIRSRNEVAKETAVLGIALQNKETGHLGNKTTSRDFYHPTEGVIAQSVNDGVITNKQAVNMLKDAVDAYSKTSKGKDTKSSLGFTSQDFSSLDQFFELVDNISFERRGTFNSTIIPSKEDLKITKATKPHTKMWIKSGVPTLRDYNEATAEPYTKNAKSHDVVKYLDPDLNSIGIDSSVQVSDAERKRAEEMGVNIVMIDDKASHTSYPVVLFGKNIGIPKFFHSLRDMANEWDVPNPFFKAGRRKDTDTPKRIPEGLKSERGIEITPQRKQVSGRPSIDEIRRYAKENKISDADVRTFLKEIGYSDSEIKLAMKKAPSAKKILGKKPIKKTVDTYAALKDQIRLESRAAREAQKDLNNKRKELASMIKDLAGKGVITANQSTVLINRVSSVNLNNERSVEKLVEYMDKVYQNAEYADNILKSNKRRKRAKKNIRSKIGSANVVFNTLNKLFSIDAKLIPQSVLDTYNDIVNQFGESRAVLNLEDISIVNEKANSILEAIDNEVSEIPKLQLLFEGLNKVIVKGKEDFSATIAQALSNKQITQEDFDLMKKYKKDIVTPVEKVEVEAEPIVLEFKKNNVEDKMEFEGAERLIELLKNKKAVEQLSDSLKRNIQAVINNIDAGFFPSYANNISNEIESIIAKDNVLPRIKKGRYVFDRATAGIKNLFSSKRSTTEYQIRQNPLSDIDNVLGNMNRTDIYDNIFGKAAKSYATLDAQIDVVHEKILEADALLFKQFKNNGNEVTESKYRIMAYMLEREFQSNKDSNKVFSASEAIKAAIESQRKEETTIYSKRDVEILKSILKDFEGDVNINGVFDKFSKREKKAISIIDEVNKSISDKALYTASIIRGSRPNMIDNYVHHSVASSNENSVESITSKYNQFKTFSTKAGTLVERTPGVKALDFDVLKSTIKGAKETLTDYHMTDTARVIFKTLNKIQKEIISDENSTDRQVETANALKKAFDTAMRQVFEMNYVNNGMNLLGKAKSLGYKALLASVPRAYAEMSSNLAYVLLTSPKSFATGIKYKEYVLDQRGRDIMINLNSEQTGKLYSKKVTGKTADIGLFVDSEGATPTGAVNGLQNKANQVLSYASKVTTKPTEKIAEALISTPDKAISRPLWFGSLDTKFKEITGNNIDMEAIRNKDSKYLTDNKDALDQATRFADKEVTRAATSINVFNGVLKNKIDPNDSITLKILKEINGFMTNFVIYEYTTARSAISALINSGQISRKKGASLLLGTVTRMSLYMVLYQTFSHIFDSAVAALTGADTGDDELPEEDLLARQLVGSITSMILGRNLGNFAKIVPNISLETINEKYLEDLRKGEDYDPYKHSISFSMISKEDLKKIQTRQQGVGDALLKSFSGPYSPIVKTLVRSVELGAKATSEKSKDSTKQRAIEELTTRIIIEMLGNMGMIPFYKDVRRIVIKDLFSEDKNKKSSSINLRRTNIIIRK